MHRLAVVTALLVSLVVPSIALAGSPVADPTVPAQRDSEAIVLTGKDFPGWAAPANQTFKAPVTDLTGDPITGDPQAGGGCTTFDENCAHNHYAKPDFDSQDWAPQSGPNINRFIGYRWNPKAHHGNGGWDQIPFQVDEMFVRYLDNSASGFAVYSGEDQHLSYAFNREGWQYYGNDAADPCKAVPGTDPSNNNQLAGYTADPVQGLDTNDELAFMASDAGVQAPSNAGLPNGIQELREVKVVDPTNKGNVTYAYVGLAKAKDGATSDFNSNNGYVRYVRDPVSSAYPYGADTYVYSQSSYDGYGDARPGRFWSNDPNHPGCVGADASQWGTKACTQSDGSEVIKPGQAGWDEAAGKYDNADAFWQCPERRRPADQTTIYTPRYDFRYDGRWLMTAIGISPNDQGLTQGNYGPDLVDRWKARAFAQDPGSKTPCCGYEEEDTNWGGSSTLMGEKWGPVRAIRETWGADSGTNVVRRETFYRNQMVQKNFLRVHVIPPLDGIYAQWDFNAGQMTQYYSSRTELKYPGGVPIDGSNDEIFGNLDDPCNSKFDQNDTSTFDQKYRSVYASLPGLCANNQLFGRNVPYHQSIDLTDPTLSDANAALGWSVTAGDNGTIVDRIRIDQATDLTPGGAAQSLVAEPYYRDDSCFDDGTGTDPGPKEHLRSADEPSTYIAPDGSTQPRMCWHPGDTAPLGSDAYYQGDIGTHGLHLLFQAESDNARLTVPVDEIVSEWQMVMLPHFHDGSAGEQYGRSFEKPLVTAVVPFLGSGSSTNGSAKRTRTGARR